MWHSYECFSVDCPESTLRGGSGMVLRYRVRSEVLVPRSVEHPLPVQCPWGCGRMSFLGSQAATEDDSSGG